MGVRAYQHAMDLVVRAGASQRRRQIEQNPDKPAPSTFLSPSSHLLLAHIALSVFENDDCIRSGQWTDDEDGALYYKGLGQRARALGYDLPENFEKHMVMHGEVDEKLYNAARMATDRALKELVNKGLLSVHTRARAGRNARYALPFLDIACGICAATGANGNRYADIERHLG